MLRDTYRVSTQAIFKVLTLSVTVCHNKPIEAAPLCLPVNIALTDGWKNLCLTERQRKMDSALTRNRKHWAKHPYQRQWKCQVKKKKRRWKDRPWHWVYHNIRDKVLSKCWWQPSDGCWLTFSPCQPSSSCSSSDSRAHLCQQSSAWHILWWDQTQGQTCLLQKQHLLCDNRYQNTTHFITSIWQWASSTICVENVFIREKLTQAVIP